MTFLHLRNIILTAEYKISGDAKELKRTIRKQEQSEQRLGTNAVFMDVKRCDGTKNILGDGTYMT